MLFTIDVGNSHTVTGLFDGDKLLGQWRLKSDRQRTADELAIRYHALFSMEGIDKNEITGIVLASVVPSLESAWVAFCEKYLSENLKKPLFIVSSQTTADMITIDTDYPEEVGADRLVNGIAAWQQYKQNLIIIDFGTAITFDCVSVDCKYLGGTILPGIAISLDALSSRAAKLPRIDVSSPPKDIIGRNTVQAMKSGILHGYGALVDGLCAKIEKELCPDNEPMRVLATGGMAHLIAPYTQSIETVDPMLTIHGLHCIYQQI